MPTGEIYDGEFHNHKPHGDGTFLYFDGSEYTGNWNMGKWHGKGTLKYPDGSTFEGEFSNGSRLQGKLKFECGIVYNGKFENDIPVERPTHLWGTMNENDSPIPKVSDENPIIVTCNVVKENRKN